MPEKAEEFRVLAISECDGDIGMLLTLSLAFVTVPHVPELEEL